MQINLGIASEKGRKYRNTLAPAQIDAIIVPTVRPAGSLRFAVDLAAETGAFLLALCSGSSSATEIHGLMSAKGATGMALDVSLYTVPTLLSGFATDAFAEATYGRTGNDTSLKRNMGLVFARLSGWEKVFFFDDDVRGINGKMLEQAVLMLPEYSAVGFAVTAFPDNSVIRHAQRLGGIEPGVQISGGALVADMTARPVSFFPNIYNEDWFFLYDRESARAVAQAEQQPYGPFVQHSRAASEEFGDVLAEGMVEMQAAGVDCGDIHIADWQELLVNRRRLLRDLRLRLKTSNVTGSERDAALAALYAAEATHEHITAVVCRKYCMAWRKDVAVWQDRLDRLPKFLSVAEVVNELGLPSTAYHLALCDSAGFY